MRDTDVNPDAINIYQPITEKQTQGTATATMKAQTFDLSMGAQSDAPACSNCGHTTIRSATCYKCLNCGTSMGCS